MSPEKGPREAILLARAAGVALKMAAKLREPSEQAYFESEVKPLLSSDVDIPASLVDTTNLLYSADPLRWATPCSGQSRSDW
jgi:hypothetical protein